MQMCRDNFHAEKEEVAEGDLEEEIVDDFLLAAKVLFGLEFDVRCNEAVASLRICS